MKPLVSIVMTVFNEEKYIAEAIESILNQSYSHFEFIIVNDGSTDNSLDIIKSFKDGRIKIINNLENLGAAVSANKGIEIASGKYIARMDSDDISFPSRIEKQVNFLEENTEIHVVGTWIKVIFENLNERSFIWRYYSDPEKIRSSLIFNPGVAHPTLMFRRGVFIESKYNSNLDSAIDYDLYSRLSKEIKFSNIQETLLLYRRHDNQMSTGINSKQQQNAKRIRNNLLRKIGIKPTEIELELHQQISNNQMGNFHLSEIIIWLEKLVYSNKKAKYFSEEDFIDIISDKLVGLINHNDIIDSNDLKCYHKSFLSMKRKLPETELNMNAVKQYLISKGISNVAIFGTKRIGLFLNQQLTSMGVNVKCFLDNSIQKQGKVISNKTIESPKWLIENKDKIDAVIISVIGEHSKEVIESLNNLTNNVIDVIDWAQLISISKRC